jgi:hypothetical protein
MAETDMEDFKEPDAELDRDPAKLNPECGYPNDRRQHRSELFEIGNRFDPIARHAETRGSEGQRLPDGRCATGLFWCQTRAENGRYGHMRTKIRPQRWSLM